MLHRLHDPLSRKFYNLYQRVFDLTFVHDLELYLQREEFSLPSAAQYFQEVTINVFES